MPIQRLEHLRAMLSSSDLLQTIPEHELDYLADRVQRVHLRRGQVVFTKMDPGSSLFFVLFGRVKILSTSPSGNEVLHNMIEPGQIFGEMALLDGEPRSTDAVAAIDTEMLAFKRPDFLDVLERNPEIAVKMMGILCGRVRRSTHFVEDAVLADAATRLANRISDLASKYGRPDVDGVSLRIEHGLSQQELGDSVGLTRVSINRLLRQWRSLGLIEDGRGYIVVRSLADLRQTVGCE